MIRLHEVIVTPIEGGTPPISRWFKTTPFSNLLSRLENLDPETVGRGDSVKIITIWMSENDLQSFEESNQIVWSD